MLFARVLQIKIKVRWLIEKKIISQVDEELDELILRIKLEEGNTEFWRRRFLGEGLNENHSKPLEIEDYDVLDVSDDADVGDDVVKEAEDDEVDEEDEEVEQTESQVGDRVKDKEAEAAKPPQMIGVQLLKDSDQSTSSSRKSKKKSSRVSMEVEKLIFVSMYLNNLTMVYPQKWTNYTPDI